MMKVLPTREGRIDYSKDMITIKKEVERAAIMTIETNLVPYPKKVKQIFLKAIEQKQILEFLLKLLITNDNGRIHFYRYIKTSIYAIGIGINLNMNTEELILLAKATLTFEKNKNAY
ncbi:hypothetical protein M670_03820 [Schinkia azotoformans MEV2011]|uniref:Uncharacterized protein n=2 Tax=Schinkia azotoformans TaxID=1454 RepID=K6D967_SCHAZ|nr:hypothetical protein [Schinkia azotoformans]EKN64623.1 hypothetical protein BAZO_12759 [Schinkia azotoformans LMG 9581]KEF36906.1 hypothetical protein M670_03820 [Schinkia azotoformans MEV2011]MEC1640065.1 hypothetical protein [Schinkia azotoformans]MEC1697087.1 hypothetical protein [Schinkia azotoformans]MEC1717838.1 hypothetical protein [Schinkia azotoformans]